MLDFSRLRWIFGGGLGGRDAVVSCWWRLPRIFYRSFWMKALWSCVFKISKIFKEEQTRKVLQINLLRKLKIIKRNWSWKIVALCICENCEFLEKRETSTSGCFWKVLINLLQSVSIFSRNICIHIVNVLIIVSIILYPNIKFENYFYGFGNKFRMCWNIHVELNFYGINIKFLSLGSIAKFIGNLLKRFLENLRSNFQSYFK